jgi:hypothetical protein
MTSNANKIAYTVESAFEVTITSACVITAYAPRPNFIPQPSDLKKYVIGVDG